jgi:3-hydroxyacyl-[acyl-carrier-protein] dehydratase
MSGQAGIDLDLEQIKALLPHRPPFLLIDRIEDLIPDRSVTGVKNVTLNEPYFQGMPRDKLFVPATMIIESIAQTAAVAALYTLSQGTAGKITYLTALQKFRARGAVRPGATLMLYAVKERSFGPSSKVSGEARVDGKLVAQVKLTATILDAGAINF